MTLRLSEVYLSIQGEGPRVGRPTVFVRFGGCNLRCPGWPCDTPHAIFPKEFRKEWKKVEPDDVYREILEAAKGLEWFNVCYTGGEPFLQKHEDLAELTELLRGNDRVEYIECFSNGTLEYPQWALDAVAFVIDWKLPGSGEYMVGEEERLKNADRMIPYAWMNAVKFTIASRADYEAARQIYWNTLKPTDFMIFYGIVWNKNVTNSTLIGWVLEDKLPWIFTMQAHNHVWDRKKRGI